MNTLVWISQSEGDMIRKGRWKHVRCMCKSKRGYWGPVRTPCCLKLLKCEIQTWYAFYCGSKARVRFVPGSSSGLETQLGLVGLYCLKKMLFRA